MWNCKRHGTSATAAEAPLTGDLSRTAAQRDALFALAQATADLLARSSPPAGDMLRRHALRCLDAPHDELASFRDRRATAP